MRKKWLQKISLFFKQFSKINPISGLIILFGSIFAFWLLSDLLLYFLFKCYKGSRGTFGDMFGAVNSLFSGLALAGIIFTVFLQIKELRLQRQELRLTRKEFSLQSKEFKDQNSILRIQRFENTFFQMLTLHYQLVAEMKFGDGKGKNSFLSFIKQQYSTLGFPIDQRDSIYNKINAAEFSEFKTEMLKKYPENNQIERERFRPFFGENNLPIWETMLGKENLNFYCNYFIYDSEYNIHKKFKEFFNDQSDLFYNYFRSLYHLYKYVYTSELINNEESQFYSKLISSQLSEYEMVVLCYNCMKGNYGYPNFSWMVKEYDILKNLNIDLLILRQKDRKFFNDNLPTQIPERLMIGRHHTSSSSSR